MTPIGGDPAQLLSRAKDLGQTAVLIQQAINDLKKLADRDETVSEAIDGVRGKASDLAGNITKAQIRFRGTADALLEYAGHLDAAQAASHEAIKEYQEASAASAGAQASFEHQSNHYASENGTPYFPGMPSALNTYAQTPAGAQAQGHLDSSNSALKAAEAKWWAAVNQLDDAAKAAISKIDDAMDASGLDDGFWDKVGSAWDGFVAWAKEYLAPILDVLQKIAEQIGSIAGFLAIVVGFLGIFFPALEVLAGVLETISLVASLVSFALTLVLVALGDRTWGDALVTGLSAVTAVVGAKFPLKVPGAVLGEKAAGGAAVAAQNVAGATFRQQAVIAAVTDEVVGGATDIITDNIYENAGSGLDKITGQERPEGLWPDPISVTPSILPNFVEGTYDAGVANPGEIGHQVNVSIHGSSESENR